MIQLLCRNCATQLLQHLRRACACFAQVVELLGQFDDAATNVVSLPIDVVGVNAKIDGGLTVI